MKIFISYSWESNDHQEWVKKLANDLEEYYEFHIMFDQYDLDGALDKNFFMEQSIFESDLILIIGTKEYALKANNRQGGVGIETYMATIKHWEESETTNGSKIFVLTREKREVSVPNYLKSKISFDFKIDEDYMENLSKLVISIKDVITGASKRPKKSKSIHTKKPKLFKFDRVDDILAINYKRRKNIDKVTNFKGKNKIKYEYWEVETLEKAYILILFENINIQQTIIQFITDQKFIPRNLTILRVNKGEERYIEKIFNQQKKVTNIKEFTIENYLWDLCIDQEWKNESKVSEDEFFIDQRLYIKQNNEKIDVGLSIQYIQKEFINNKVSSAVLMIFASGGMGKSTLSQVLTNKINEKEDQRAILIQSEYMRENINKEINRTYEISNLFQLYDIYMRLFSNNKSLLTEKEFDLGVISGKIILLLDGLDEIISLFQDNFNLTKFIDSLELLHNQLGKSKIIITSRINILNNNIFLYDNENISLLFLRGFEEDIWLKYIDNRFKAYASSEELVRKVKKHLAMITEIVNGNKVVLPFFLDLICEIIEDEFSNSKSSFIIDTVNQDYKTRGDKLDYLIHAIFKREIIRQEYNISIRELNNLFKDLAVSYGNIFSKDNLKELVEYHFESNDIDKIYQKVLLSPLLVSDTNENIIRFKYDFLSNYFISLFLIDTLSKVTTSSELDLNFIKQMDKLHDGTNILMDELVKYFTKNISECMTLVKMAIELLNIKIKTIDEKSTQFKHAISALLYLTQKIHSEELSQDKRRTIINQLYDESKIEHLYIWGEFYPIDFSNTEIWFSSFHGFNHLCESRLVNTKFYHSRFEDILIDNCSSISIENFELETCTLGSLNDMLQANKKEDSEKFTVLEKKLTTFLRNFFDRGNFCYKKKDHISMSPLLHRDLNTFIDLLVNKNILEKEKLIKNSYGIKSTFEKDVKNLLQNNHLCPNLKLLIEELL